MPSFTRPLWTVPLTLLLLATVSVQAADWAQWQGPNRNSISPETGLRSTFPADFKPAWSFKDCGIGYSAPAVVNDDVYLLGADKQENGDYVEFALALDPNGKQLWKTEVTNYKEGIMLSKWGHGPRSTPSIADGRLFGIGGNGDLFALDQKTGKILWQVNMREAFGSSLSGARGKPENTWGYCESPLVDGKHVICTPGGDQGTVVSLEAATGKLVWQSKELTDACSYSSAVIADFGGVKQYVVLSAKQLAGVRASDGKLLWTAEVPVNEIAVIPTPIVSGNLVYTTCDYDAGCGLVEVNKAGDKFTAKVLYKNKTMSNHHGGVVLIDGKIYGWSGKTSARGRWVCQDLKTGESVWMEGRAAPAGCVIAADGHIYCFTQDDGELVCIEANSKEFKETGRFTIPERTKQQSLLGKVWARPVISNGKLYLRDQDLLFCYDIKEDT
ncbi:PQQ-binding-like beta-propeller repeat protein [Gimesia fumaroli]|uniref:Outer membrane biogenesis protein BamB n=1 Tax=Gimesia fumaroli TaxID=2527976 RepID=A0A518IEQ6_9PLAN|nr:PQQ-binding-like beta-propeller repeat protein [Gimesia fumaroli]QDV51550.1 outer membrane biogenesis protein BamB [Gimesia fumaroli]